jgi:hypothetical protein
MSWAVVVVVIAVVGTTAVAARRVVRVHNKWLFLSKPRQTPPAPQFRLLIERLEKRRDNLPERLNPFPNPFRGFRDRIDQWRQDHPMPTSY